MDRLKELRINKGWKQRELADHLHTNQQTIARYESGERAPDLETIGKLCDIFGCTSDYLLGRSPVPAAEISNADWLLLDAYHRASLRDRQLVDSILREYRADDKKVDAL